MDCCLSYTNPSFCVSPTLPSRALLGRSFAVAPPIQRRPLIVVASSSSGIGYLNAPLEPSTPAGKFLSGVFLDDSDRFQDTARKELEQLAAQRDQAVARLRLSLGSGEACLHRRIAELKTQETRQAVEDVMYMLVIHKFSKIKVHLIPTLSQCIFNHRLEILPSKNWELESIYTFEVLEIVRDHVNTVVGLKPNSTVTESWATTEIQRGRLCKFYAASILFGYFLKSASLRYRLEWGLESGICSQVPVLGMYPLQLGISKNTAFGCVTSPRFMPVGHFSEKREDLKGEDLKGYVMGFDHEMIQMCAMPKSKEALDLIERHSRALFGDEKTGLVDSDEMICTSFASLKRIVLEAVAFGFYLWETERCVNDVYTLDEN